MVVKQVSNVVVVAYKFSTIFDDYTLFISNIRLSLMLQMVPHCTAKTTDVVQ